MNALKMPLLIVVALLAFLGWNSVFVVDERQLAIKFQLGEIVRSEFEPGFYFKFPFVNNVQKFDRRVLTLDSQPEQILTGEKKNVLVDYFVKWRISNIESFYRAFGGREMDAASRLAQTIKDGLQAELGNRTIKEVVSGDRVQIMANVTNNVDSKMGQFGIQVVDVRIKQIELPANVASSVFERMRAERERIAKEHRAKGEKEARIIRARADRERTEILAGARRKAEEIRGAGDAKATETYAKAYGSDADFYEFYRSMEAYRNTFDSKDDVLVLEPDSEFFEYFVNAGGSR